MTRYNWPREFVKSPDRLAARFLELLRTAATPLPPSFQGNMNLLDDVIAHNFEDDRTWVPLGPTTMVQGSGASKTTVSGRVRDIKVSPNGQRAYIGSANGGVWYTSDTGATWSPIGSGSLASSADRADLSLTIGALFVEFGQTAGADDPSKDVVYAASGEAMADGRGGVGGHLGGFGILRMKDPVATVIANPRSNPWQREAPNLSYHGIYRLIREPTVTPTMAGAGSFLAATSKGLFKRTGVFTEDADWAEVDINGIDFEVDTHSYVSDVVWNNKGIFVAVGGDSTDGGVYRSTNGTTGPFTRIVLPNLLKGSRISLGEAKHATNRIYVLSRRACPVDPVNNQPQAHLWQIDVDQTPIRVREVERFPMGLFVSEVKRVGGNFVIKEGDQSSYDQAITVRQSTSDAPKDMVTVGGSLELTGTNWSAALFDLRIDTISATRLRTNFNNNRQATARSDPTYIGNKIHPDVHALTYSGTALWVGCDGGVFRKDGANLRSLNSGLATLEVSFIASHPTFEGTMIGGTQDNGSIERVGDTVWELQKWGDGGGCIYHPTKPHYRIMQYTNASWNFTPDSFRPRGPVNRSLNGSLAKETTESGRSEFYSQGVSAKSNNANDARLFIGTDRIWYSADWDEPGTHVSRRMNWVTIPTASDPYGPSNLTQDQLMQGGNPDKVKAIDILQEGDLADDYNQMAILVLCERTVRVFRYTKSTNSWTTLANSIVSGASRAPGRKANAPPDFPAPFTDKLPMRNGQVWTDIAVHETTMGSESFYVTTTGALIDDPDNATFVDYFADTLWWYNGAGRWYPTNLRTTPLDASNGTGGSPAPAHSVVVDPDVSDIVYVGNALGVWEGRIDRSGTHPTWSWKPAMEGLPQTLVQDLSVIKTDNSSYLRAAMVARGVWERDISAVPASVGRSFIRALPYDTGRYVLPANPVHAQRNSSLKYHESPDIIVLSQTAHSWDPNMPNEADLYNATMPRSFSKRTYDAYVMAHQRHTTAVAANDMNIDVFLQKSAPRGLISDFAITDDWRDAVLDAIRLSSPTMPTGLSHLGRFHPTGPVDARTPRAVGFDLDLNFSGRRDYVMLIAVVTSPNNGLASSDLAHPDLQTIVRNCGQLAVRKIRRR